MRKPTQDTRLVNGGVNSDVTPALVGKNELLNVINMTPINPYASDDQQQESLSTLYAPQLLNSVNSLLLGTDYTLLNKLVDERTNSIFLFLDSVFFGSFIIRYFPTADTASIIFRDSYVTGGLQWIPTSYMSAALYGNQLIFTDGINNIRCIDVSRTYSAGTPISQNELSLIVEPIHVPLIATRITEGTLYSNVVQLGAWQFSIRVKNQFKVNSVLAPYSETVTPVRQSEIHTTPQSGNAIQAQLSFQNPIPPDWEQIDFVARNMDLTDTFYVYRSLYSSNAADVAEVAAHNSSTTNLSATYTGVNIETLSDLDALTRAETIPLTSQFASIGVNRLILSNNLVGYDTPTTPPTNLTVTPTTINAPLPSGTYYTTWLILTKNFDLDEDDFPIYAALVVWIGGSASGGTGSAYAIPFDYNKFRFNGTFQLQIQDSENYPYLPPNVIPKSKLVKLNIYFPPGSPAAIVPDPFEYFGNLSDSVNNGFNLRDAFMPYNQTLARLVWEAFGMGENPTGDWRAYGTPGSSPPTDSYIGISKFRMYGAHPLEIYVTDEESEFASGSASEAFLPNSEVKYGITYTDDALRSCGVQELGSINLPSFTPFAPQLVSQLTFDVSGIGAGAPSWAKYFLLTMSKPNLCDRFIQFAPDIIKIARKDEDGVISINSDLGNNFNSDTIYGVAVSINSLSDYNRGYAYTPSNGDSVKLSFGGGDPDSMSVAYEYQAAVINALDGYVIIAPPKDDIFSSTLVIYLSSQFKIIASPTYVPAFSAAVSNDVSSWTLVRQRQNWCFATIYIGQQADFQQYEIAAAGTIAQDGPDDFYPNSFFSGLSGTSTTFNLGGDCYTQRRSSDAGNFTGLSDTTNESVVNLKWVLNGGRLVPLDRVGQQLLTGEIRWSDTGSLTTNVSGIGNFQAVNYRLVENRAGAITMTMTNIGDVGQNDLMLITCVASSYYTLLGQSYLRTSQNAVNVTQSSNFVEVLTELEGRPASQSPRSFAIMDGAVMFVDVQNRALVNFKSGNVEIVSDIKTQSTFERLLKKIFNTGLSARICGGVNPLTGEYIAFMPNDSTQDKAFLPTTFLEYPLNFYYDQAWCWVFNAKRKSWSYIMDAPSEFFSINNNVFSWDSEEQKFYKEFIESGAVRGDAMVVIPFNENYPSVKTPISLTVDSNRAPDETWIQCDTSSRLDSATTGPGSTMVANVQNWQYREGLWQTNILRDRLSNNAVTQTEWDMSGVTGHRLKGKIVNVILIWRTNDGHANIVNCTLRNQVNQY